MMESAVFDDDVIILGRYDGQHDESIRQRWCEIDISLNQDKCCFVIREIPFRATKISSIGL